MARTEVELEARGRDQADLVGPSRSRSGVGRRDACLDSLRTRTDVDLGPKRRRASSSDRDDRNTEVLARPTRACLRSPQCRSTWPEREPSAVFGDGDFEVFDLSDPSRLAMVAEYRRDRDLARFDGREDRRVERRRIRLRRHRLVRLDGEDAHRERAWGRDRVGLVAHAESIDGEWLLATNRGLLQLDPDSDQVRTLIAGRSCERHAGRAIESSSRTGSRSSSHHCRRCSPAASSKNFIWAAGSTHSGSTPAARTAVVLGARDAASGGTLRSSPPRLLSRISAKDAGRIHDASLIGDQLFLIGPRGLQVTDPSGQRVVDSVDVDARRRIEAARLDISWSSARNRSKWWTRLHTSSRRPRQPTPE